MFNLQITVTTDSYLSLEKFRGYVNRIIWVQGCIFVLILRLIYHRIYGKNLTSSFSKSVVYLIGQIEESWRFRTSWILKVELSCWVIKIGDFYWLGIVLVACKEWQHGKKNSLFKILLTPFYPVSGRPLFLPGMGRIASSLLNPVLKMS